MNDIVVDATVISEDAQELLYAVMTEFSTTISQTGKAPEINGIVDSQSILLWPDMPKTEKEKIKAELTEFLYNNLRPAIRAGLKIVN